MVKMKGVFLLLVASLLFSVASAFLKLCTQAPYFFPSTEATFMRFFLGVFLFGAIVIARQESLKPVNLTLVLWRALTNTLAVLLFFAGIKYTTLTKSVLLNQTYPVFIFLLAPYINREKVQSAHFVFLFLTLAGAWCIIRPAGGFNFSTLNTGDILAFLSGIMAAFALSILRESRKYDSSPVILFYLMAIGSVISGVVMLPFFVVPRGMAAVYVFLTAAFAVIGQLALTVGYRYIDAAMGSVVLGSGILFAALIGSVFFRDPLTLLVVAGGGLIVLSLLGISGILSFLKQK